MPLVIFQGLRTSHEFQLIAQASQKQSNWLPMRTSQIHLGFRPPFKRPQTEKPSQICEDLMDLLNSFLNLHQIVQKKFGDTSSSSDKGLNAWGGVLPYLDYTGTCRWTGYGFLASLS